MRDTDGDRIIDCRVCALESDGTDPASRPSIRAPADDAEGDGLSDDFETNSLATDPNDIDTDDDRILDGIE